MFQLKPLSPEAVPRALQKAEHYRLLNEPAEAESICLDILHIEPDHQQALITLLLALTDQFGSEIGPVVTRVEDVLARLRGEYERAYYTGIVCERRAKARLHHGGPGAEFRAYHWLEKAMACYERAESLCAPGNEDATLRWNTCARILMANPQLQPGPEYSVELPLE
jgi:hypothetical protein